MDGHNWKYKICKTQRRKGIDMELKSCPFCGGEAELVQNIDHKEWFVMCCEGKLIMCWYEKRDEAIKAWNTRVNEPPEPTLKDYLPEPTKTEGS